MKENKKQNILLTGGTGKLGKKIIESGLFDNIYHPSSCELNILDFEAIKSFIELNRIDCVIHCAALARMSLCEKNPIEAINVNVIGTANIVSSIHLINSSCKLIYLSSDGVYACKDGNYSEDSPTEPYNIYGHTKLSAESLVKTLKRHLIVRTRFFDKNVIPFNESAVDIKTSSIEISALIKVLSTLLIKDILGVINVGEESKSDYERYIEFKPTLKKCLRSDIQERLEFNIASDASMNLDKLTEALK